MNQFKIKSYPTKIHSY